MEIVNMFNFGFTTETFAQKIRHLVRLDRDAKFKEPPVVFKF